MSRPIRQSAVVFGRLQSKELRLAAARRQAGGLQVFTIEHLASRLAGGFYRPIEDEALRKALQTALVQTPLGELESIKLLPGMVEACAGTLRKAWTAQLDLATVGDHPRLASLAALETAVLELLPSGMLRPWELAERAISRSAHAPAVLGDVTLYGMTELEPCWRPLLLHLSTVVKVRWDAGPRSIPPWLGGSNVEVIQSAPATPQTSTVSCASALHEAVEATRWARNLVANGQARPGEIAFASASTAEFDDHFLALRADANLPIHFAHGTKISASRDGQAAAALADILLRGLTQRRFRRLVALAGSAGPLSELPDGWLRVLPVDAPLSSARSWHQLLSTLSAADWPGGVDLTPQLRAVVEALLVGPEGAEACGVALLRGRASSIWKKALAAGPATSLDLTLQALHEDDGLESSESIAWMPASHLGASPRRFVRLLGLNSSRWPRRQTEDRLLSDHIIPTEQLDPLPISAADRRDFDTVRSTTQSELVLSFSRRDSEGRLLGQSSLLQGLGQVTYLRRHRKPEHAFSEADRLASRSQEFNATAQALSADRCWRNWWRPDLTPNDGLIRADHPVLLAAVSRTQSASSLSVLLRNPLRFMWQYGAGLRLPQVSEEPLVLDPLEFGNLVHEVLDASVRWASSQRTQGVTADLRSSLNAGVEQVRTRWEALHATPPAFIWRRTLGEVSAMALYALEATSQQAAGWTTYSEVPFGGNPPNAPDTLPWDPSREVNIPGTGLRVGGYIDRLDVNDDMSQTIVTDYKTGKAPSKDIVLKGGQELQRCLYAFAVKSLLGEATSVQPSLLYLRTRQLLPMVDPQRALEDLQGYLSRAREGLTAGNALPGPDAGNEFDDFAFALPANAEPSYCRRKKLAVLQCLGNLADVWEAV